MGRIRALLALIPAILLPACAGTLTGQASYLGQPPAATSSGSGGTGGVPSSTSDPATTTPPGTGTTASGSTTFEPTGTPPSAGTTAATTTTSGGTTSAGGTTDPTSPSSQSGPPPSGGELTAQSWTVRSTQFSADPAGNFQGTARITNTADRSRSAGFTFTLFQGETLLASLIGFGTEVPAGDTVTVSLISIDPYVDGEYSIDFQVDYTF